MTVERGLDDTPLHAAPSPVNQPNLTNAGIDRGLDVSLDN